jgi:hypothetical protein
MQAHGAAQGGVGTTTMPRGDGWLKALLAVVAILVIVAVMALMTRGVVAPVSSGVRAQDAKAGAAVVHDDAGNMPLTGAGAAIVHDDAANMPATGTGAAVVHDDAGDVR